MSERSRTRERGRPCGDSERLKRADTLRSTGTTNEGYASESGRSRYEGAVAIAQEPSGFRKMTARGGIVSTKEQRWP